jgi:stress response protein YsnF
MTRTDKKDFARGTVVEEAVLPVVEERVRIDKTVEQGRTVTVTTRPVTETETLSQKLAHERVTVERVPIGQVVNEMPSVREEGDLTVIPVVEQRARVVVEQVLVEEIHLRRTREETVENFKVERQRTEVDIDE